MHNTAFKVALIIIVGPILLLTLPVALLLYAPGSVNDIADKENIRGFC